MTFRTWVANVLLALAVAAVLIPFPIRAGAQEGCGPASDLKQIASVAKRFEVLKDDPLKRAIEIGNHFAPEPREWEAAYLVIGVNGNALLIFGMADTVCGVLTIPQHQANDALLFIFGQTV